MFTQLYQRQDTARPVSRALATNHARAVSRALATNHARAMVAVGRG